MFAGQAEIGCLCHVTTVCWFLFFKEKRISLADGGPDEELDGN